MTTRNRKVTFRMSEDELARLQDLVAKSGWSQEAYIRSVLAGVEPANKPPPEFAAMTRELHAIGVNLNQIARKANQLGVVDAARYDAEAANLRQALAEIVTAVKAPRRT